MSKKGGAGIKQMYEDWNNAIPAKPFPFQYGDIKCTWADVRSKLQRDIVSTAITFSTGHITPGVAQSLVLTDMHKRERRHHNHAQHQSPSSDTNASQQQQPDINRALNASNGTASSLGSKSLKDTLTKEEAELLYNAEGGGRGRIQYLKKRRGMAPIARYKLPMLSSHNFGWEVDRETAEQEHVKYLSSVDPVEAQRIQQEIQSHKSQNQREDHRRKAGMVSLMRTCGVFHTTEEFSVFPPFK
eukprot:PhF_6_TR13533/c0_g1_i1/m.21632